MSKPVSLILANTVHEAASQIANIPDALKPLIKDDPEALRHAVARQALCKIAHDAGIAIVLRALVAVGAVASLDEIGAMLDAARDVQARETGTTPEAAQ